MVSKVDKSGMSLSMEMQDNENRTIHILDMNRGENKSKTLEYKEGLTEDS